MPSLDELSQKLMAISDRIDAITAENPMSQEDQDALLQEWLSADGDVQSKLEAYARRVLWHEQWAETQKAEADRITAHARTHANSAAWMKRVLCGFMKAHNIPKTETPVGPVRVVQNGGAQPIEYMPVDPETLPEVFQRHLVEADKATIVAALKDAPNGVLLGANGIIIAQYKERGHHVRIG